MILPLKSPCFTAFMHKKKESTIQLIPFFLLLNYSKNKYFL